MVEYLVKYTIDDKQFAACTVIAKTITHALDLVETYIEKEYPQAETYEIKDCHFVKKIDNLIIEKVY